MRQTGCYRSLVMKPTLLARRAAGFFCAGGAAHVVCGAQEGCRRVRVGCAARMGDADGWSSNGGVSTRTKPGFVSVLCEILKCV